MSRLWRVWLIVWILSVILFGLVLAGGASEATDDPVRLLLASLQGPGEASFDPTLRFSLALMGCVSLGWAATMLAVMAAAFRAGAQAPVLWRALTFGLLVWFVTDSALSVATGFGLNAVLNIVLLVGYLVPVLAGGAFRTPPASAAGEP